MWNDKTLEQIVSGKNADGSSSLESFLKDYSNQHFIDVVILPLNMFYVCICR